MKIQTPHLNLASREHYLAEVCNHVAKLLIQLGPVAVTGQLPIHAAAAERSPVDSPFSLGLALLLGYLSGSMELAADEVPDLLLQVHEMVRGVRGCEDLEIAIRAAQAESALHSAAGASAPAPSRYTEAVRYAGALPDPAPQLCSDSARGLAIGSNFRVDWGDVRSPRLSLSAAMVAAYAEGGHLEDGVPPTDYVEGLVLLISSGGGVALDEHPSLQAMCRDALERALRDDRLDAAAKLNAESYLEALTTS